MEKTICVTSNCRVCGTPHDLFVESKDWDTFNSPNRPLIQDIFPYLSISDREMLISGICNMCWNELFGEEE